MLGRSKFAGADRGLGDGYAPDIRTISELVKAMTELDINHGIRVLLSATSCCTDNGFLIIRVKILPAVPDTPTPWQCVRLNISKSRGWRR